MGSAIWWTWETEDVFARVRKGAKTAMKTFSAKLSAQLTELTSMARASAPVFGRLGFRVSASGFKPSALDLSRTQRLACGGVRSGPGPSPEDPT